MLPRVKNPKFEQCYEWYKNHAVNTKYIITCNAYMIYERKTKNFRVSRSRVYCIGRYALGRVRYSYWVERSPTSNSKLKVRSYNIGP